MIDTRVTNTHTINSVQQLVVELYSIFPSKRRWDDSVYIYMEAMGLVLLSFAWFIRNHNRLQHDTRRLASHHYIFCLVYMLTWRYSISLREKISLPPSLNYRLPYTHFHLHIYIYIIYIHIYNLY